MTVSDSSKLGKVLAAILDNKAVIRQSYLDWYRSVLRPKLADIREQMGRGVRSRADQDSFALEVLRILKSSLYTEMEACAQAAEAAASPSAGFKSFTPRRDEAKPATNNGELTPEEIVLSKIIDDLDAETPQEIPPQATSTAQSRDQH